MLQPRALRKPQESDMIGLAIKAVGVGFLLYGLTLSARNGLNRATTRRSQSLDDAAV